MARVQVLELRSSPHLRSGSAVDVIMRNVIWALLPTAAFAVYSFGLAALLTLLTALASCVVSEALLNRAAGRPGTVADGSVWITGLLYGLTLPPALPLWMTAVGGFIAVAMGKFLFGGLGQNPFNPALVGRAFLQAAFPVAMTTWTPAFLADRFSALPSALLAPPFASPVYDAVSAATPLSLMKFEGQIAATKDLVFGLTSGSTGETAALLILAGGAYLALRRMLDWRIPVSILTTVAVLTGLLHLWQPDAYPTPQFMLFSGGLMLGAWFMATDMVGSPITPLGAVLYGVLIGLLVTVIRLYGGMPEGVMYAILLANAVSPHLDNLLRPRVFGHGRRA
jgi:electron transport complex protein RnfD